MEPSSEERIMILYNPNLVQTLGDKYYFRELMLTSEQFDGLLVLVYLYLSFRIKDFDKKINTEYFVWTTDESQEVEDITELIGADNGLREDIDNLVQSELVLDSLGTGIELPEIYTQQEIRQFIQTVDPRKLPPSNQEINIITNPEKYPWFILSSETSEYLIGVKLGCKLYNLNQDDYLLTDLTKIH